MDKAAVQMLEFALTHFGVSGAVLVFLMLCTLVVAVHTIAFTRTMRASTAITGKVLATLETINSSMTSNVQAHTMMAQQQGQQTEAIRNLVDETRTLRDSTIRRESDQGKQLAVILERLAGTGGGRRDWEKERIEQAAQDHPAKREGC